MSIKTDKNGNHFRTIPASAMEELFPETTKYLYENGCRWDMPWTEVVDLLYEAEHGKPE